MLPNSDNIKIQMKHNKFCFVYSGWTEKINANKSNIIYSCYQCYASFIEATIASWNRQKEKVRKKMINCWDSTESVVLQCLVIIINIVQLKETES